MKSRLFYVIVLSFILSYSFGQTNTLSIASDKEPFILHLNSKAINSIANKVVIAPTLNAGKNHVRLSFSKKGIPELSTHIEVPNDGQLHQVSYKVVTAAKGPYSLALISDMILAQNQNTAATTDVENNNKTNNNQGKKKPENNNKGKNGSSNSSDKTNSTDNTATNQNVGIVSSANENGMSTTISTGSNGNNGTNGQISINISTSDLGMNTNVNTNDNNTTKTQANPYAGKVPQVANGLVCSKASVSSQALMQLKYKISQIYLDMNKAKEAKDFMNTNCLTSAQVADLVKLMSYDQLDVAQFGFMHTYDQSKYEVVVNALTSDYDKEKLLSFIGSYDGTVTTPESSSNQSVSTNQNQTINYTVTTTSSQGTQTEAPAQTSTTQSAYQSFNTGCTPMDGDDFAEALEAADEPINEDKKMEVVKSVFDDQCFNTTQVASIVDLFINEDRKLDVAKWAFSRTSDKDKYYRLNKAFINEQRKAELSQFVKNNK